MTLTDNQKKALSEIKASRVYKRRYGYGAWRINDAVSPTVVGRLLSLGLCEWHDNGNVDGTKLAVLTASGRAALEDHDAGLQMKEGG
ncbi:hypothetical protein [Bartonella sp. LJL80]